VRFRNPAKEMGIRFVSFRPDERLKMHRVIEHLAQSSSSVSRKQVTQRPKPTSDMIVEKLRHWFDVNSNLTKDDFLCISR